MLWQIYPFARSSHSCRRSSADADKPRDAMLDSRLSGFVISFAITEKAGKAY